MIPVIGISVIMTLLLSAMVASLIWGEDQATVRWRAAIKRQWQRMREPWPLSPRGLSQALAEQFERDGIGTGLFHAGGVVDDAEGRAALTVLPREHILPRRMVEPVQPVAQTVHQPKGRVLEL